MRRSLAAAGAIAIESDRLTPGLPPCGRLSPTAPEVTGRRNDACAGRAHGRGRFPDAVTPRARNGLRDYVVSGR